MTSWAEHAARSFEPAPPPAWPTPGALAVDFDPRTRQTPALELIDAAIAETVAEDDGRLIISVAPQEGKSQRTSRWTPRWVLEQNPETRIAIVSYELGVARRWGRAVRDDISTYPTELRVREDLSAQHEWQLDGHEGGVYAVGIGGALTSRPVDLMIIDDPVKDREQADSQVFRDRNGEWWTDVGTARLAPGASVILILTRWHNDDLAGRLLAAEDGDTWRVLNIPAQADHRPEKGEVDVLGREPGEFMVSARGRTQRQWEARKVTVGPRTWASLYQGRPTPDSGGLFDRESWSRYSQQLHVVRADGSCWVPGNPDSDMEIAQSWDLTFKDTKGSDYVVGQVWLRIGIDAYLLDQVRDRMTFTATCQAFRALSAKWPQAIAKFVEDKANGPAVINALSRTVPGLIPVEPEGSKYARAAAVSPLVAAKNVHLPQSQLAPWADGLIEEAAEFPAVKNDDQVDALSQALNRLLLMPLLAETVIEDQVFEETDARGYAIAPY